MLYGFSDSPSGGRPFAVRDGVNFSSNTLSNSAPSFRPKWASIISSMVFKRPLAAYI